MMIRSRFTFLGLTQSDVETADKGKLGLGCGMSI